MALEGKALMRRIIIREARPGMQVARQVPHPRDASQILLATNALLKVDDIIRLHELGVYDLWVDDADLGQLEQLQRAANADPAQQRIVNALIRTFQNLPLLGIQLNSDLLLKRNRFTIDDTMTQLVQTASAFPCAKGIVQAEELLQHSADVAVLATLLGLQLENYLIDQRRRLNCRQAKDVLNLALGAFLHDVGETLLPPQQRESKSSLATDADAPSDWKQHTHLGYMAVRKHLDPSGAAVVLHHHQHFDGSGFACVEEKELQQTGSSIHVFARISSVADMFHHLLTAPEAGVPRTIVQVLWQLQQATMRGWFDTTVLSALLAMVRPFAPGMVVMLNDRRQAVVTRINEQAPCYPEVQVLRDEEEPASTPAERIDLSQCTEMRILEVGGEDITTYLYGVRQAQPLAAA